VPADGFFEWRTEGGAKQPYLIGFEDRRPFAFAGLWERWTGGAEAGVPPVVSFTILTTKASEALRPIDHRMPVILAPEDHNAWLDVEAAAPDAARALLRPFEAPGFAPRPVSTRVNNVRNDDPSVLDPPAGPPARNGE
jgi:putative SOS response-associated peptidase YedK